MWKLASDRPCILLGFVLRSRQTSVLRPLLSFVVVCCLRGNCFQVKSQFLFGKPDCLFQVPGVVPSGKRQPAPAACIVHMLPQYLLSLIARMSIEVSHVVDTNSSVCDYLNFFEGCRDLFDHLCLFVLRFYFAACF